MKYIFLTLRDFNKVGGGSIRIHGVVNALAEKGENVILISGAEDHSPFHPDIKHIKIEAGFKNKAVLQGLTALLPATVVINLFPDLFRKILTGFKQVDLNHARIFFFEYLDNSIGYLLKKTGNIGHYITDIHGIAPIEFAHQKRYSTSFLHRAIATLKYALAMRHDQKVYQNADGIIYSSSQMKKYFENHFRMDRVKAFVLPNLLADEVFVKTEDLAEIDQLSAELGISTEDIVLFFAGGFKPTSGVDDLVKIFVKLRTEFPALKLILIGKGPLKAEVQRFINDLQLEQWIIQREGLPYEELFRYQALADIIVCPDRMNEFSEMILHLKYLDSLVSGKIVVNGAFSSVKEINKDENLSVNFMPSDEGDLYQVLKYCILRKEELTEKYKNVRKYAKNHLTYRSQINTIIH